MKKTLYIISVVLGLLGGVALGACLGEYFVSQSLNLIELIVGCVLIVIAIILEIIMNVVGSKNVKKNRKIIDVEIDATQQAQLESTIQSILKNNGYTLIPYNNEHVYKKGQGLWTARKFINYYFDNNKLYIEGWVSIGVGNKPNEEFPIDENFFIKVPKQQVQKVMNDIVAISKKN